MSNLAIATFLMLLIPACTDTTDGSEIDQRGDDSESTDPAACGSVTCTADQYCEIVRSDIPEFENNTSYERYTCRSFPVCGPDNLCDCIASTDRCEYGSSSFGGTCEQRPDGGYTLTCNIGG